MAGKSTSAPSPPPPTFDPEKHERPQSAYSSSSSSSSLSIAFASLREAPLTPSKSRQSQTLSRTVSEVRDGIQNQRDLDVAPVEDEKGLGTDGVVTTETDENLVTWEGPDDPMNPKMWKNNRKWAVVLCVSFFTLVTPMASSMVAPALPAIAADLNIPSSFTQALVLSIFVLAFALGPLLWGPLSELYGRVIIIQIANVWFLLFNLGCGLSHTPAQILACRFFSGLGGSSTMAVGGGVLSDLFTPEERGKAISIYSLMPLLGPAVGPIAGGWISDRTSWRWIFYSTTLACALIQAVGVVLLRETYAPIILARKRARLVAATGNDALRTEYDAPDRTLIQALAQALTRPMRLLFSQVIVQVLAIYMMFIYGVLYLVLSTFPRLWTERYHEATGIASLNYLSLGLGFSLGSYLCAPLQDRIYAYLKRRVGNGVGRPEFRVPMMIPGAVLVPVGLLIYGWTAQAKTHWILPNIGAVLYAAGTIIGFQCLQGYLVDSFSRYAASAVGAVTVLRSLAGFGFPLFGPAMYESLNYGMGDTVLAIFGIVLGLPGPLLLWKYGERIRARSQFSA